MLLFFSIPRRPLHRHGFARESGLRPFVPAGSGYRRQGNAAEKQMGKPIYREGLLFTAVKHAAALVRYGFARESGLCPFVPCGEWIPPTGKSRRKADGKADIPRRVLFTAAKHAAALVRHGLQRKIPEKGKARRCYIAAPCFYARTQKGKSLKNIPFSWERPCFDSAHWLPPSSA